MVKESGESDKQQLIKDNYDSESEDEWEYEYVQEAPSGCCDVFRRSWAWRKIMGKYSSFLAPIEYENTPPESVQTFSGIDLEVRPSPGCGLGVFAVSDLQADVFLDLYEGQLKTDEQMAKEWGAGGAYVMEIGADSSNLNWSVDASKTEYNWCRYMNHSSTPNVEWYPHPDGEDATHSVKGSDGKLRKLRMPRQPRVECWTCKVIKAGEELRIDYGEEYAEQLQKDLRLVGRDLQ